LRLQHPHGHQFDAAAVMLDQIEQLRARLKRAGLDVDLDVE